MKHRITKVVLRKFLGDYRYWKRTSKKMYWNLYINATFQLILVKFSSKFGLSPHRYLKTLQRHGFELNFTNWTLKIAQML